MKQLNPLWERDDIQFPRLLSEIMATQDKLDLVALEEAMDLSIEDVVELFERAQTAWERWKLKNCPPLAGAKGTPCHLD